MEQQTVTLNGVRALLVAAGNAHHDFEQNELGGIYDQDWPSWYANYLLSHGLGGLIDRLIAEDELSRLLQVCDLEYRRDQRQEEWPDYYAWRIVAGG